MVDNKLWWADIFDRIYTIVKKRLTTELEETYPNIYITNEDSVTKDNEFPTVYIHELPTNEIADDLEADTIFGINSTIQIDVYAKNMTTVKGVMPYAVMNMKKLMYKMNAGPLYTTVDGVAYGFVRCRRRITHNDSL